MRVLQSQLKGDVIYEENGNIEVTNKRPTILGNI